MSGHFISIANHTVAILILFTHFVFFLIENKTTTNEKMSRKATICGYMGCRNLTTDSKCPECTIKAMKDYEKACGRECLGCKKLITSRKAKVCPECFEKGVRECLHCKAVFTDKYYKICGTCFANGVRQCVKCKKVIDTGYKLCTECYLAEKETQEEQEYDECTGAEEQEYDECTGAEGEEYDCHCRDDK